MKKKILIVFGTRPEAIKMAPLIRAMKNSTHLQPVVCTSAQHRELLDNVLDLFGIIPDYDLDIMRTNQGLSDITSAVLLKLEPVIKAEQPDLVCVHGDTTTTLAAALCAYYNKIPVAHVEAGLRSGNIKSPFPEELNRKILSSIADYHFVPTQRNLENLVREGVDHNKIYITGNTVIDALKLILEKPYHFNGQLDKVDFDKKIIVLTVHRRENWGAPISNIFGAIKSIVKYHQDVEVVFPVHPNPRIKEEAYAALGRVDRVHLVSPMDYQAFANLLNRCYVVVTDSGGIQEEAPVLGKPVLVVRTETERPEAVEAGTVKVIGWAQGNVFREINRILTDSRRYFEQANAVSPYGDGMASVKILKILIDSLIAENKHLA